MGVLNILVLQALQTINRWLVDSCHKPTITQLLRSVCVVLSKFDIDTKIGVYAVFPNVTIHMLLKLLWET